MTKSAETARTYAERYCEARNIALEQFEEDVLGRVLHRPGRLIWPLFRPFSKTRFEIDRFCIQMIGKYRSQRKMNGELAEFSYHPEIKRFGEDTEGYAYRPSVSAE